MRLSAFIREHSKEIIAEWETFAASLVPAADGMTPLSLRNHISYILAFISGFALGGILVALIIRNNPDVAKFIESTKK